MQQDVTSLRPPRTSKQDITTLQPPRTTQQPTPTPESQGLGRLRLPGTTPNRTSPRLHGVVPTPRNDEAYNAALNWLDDYVDKTDPNYQNYVYRLNQIWARVTDPAARDALVEGAFKQHILLKQLILHEVQPGQNQTQLLHELAGKWDEWGSKLGEGTQIYGDFRAYYEQWYDRHPEGRTGAEPIGGPRPMKTSPPPERVLETPGPDVGFLP